LRGDFQLPSREAQLEYIEMLAKWKAKHIAFEPCRSSTIGTRFFHYNDELLADMKLKTGRKSNIFADLFAKHSPNDWKTLKEELDRKYNRNSSDVND
jgi:hypothetical protein